MKIIDILNKIANDEEAPKKIKWKNKFYYYDELENDYVNDTFTSDWIFENLITNILNDEVEIIAEPKEDKIENLPIGLIQTNKGIHNTLVKNGSQYELDDKEEIICYKINEIIDRLNNL